MDESSDYSSTELRTACIEAVAAGKAAVRLIQPLAAILFEHGQFDNIQEYMIFCAGAGQSAYMHKLLELCPNATVTEIQDMMDEVGANTQVPEVTGKNAG